MARCLPERPKFANDAERQVWERLREGLGADDVLLANLRLTDEVKDHEADLVVLMPDAGLVVLEVKGGAVRYDEGWRQWRGGREAAIDPVTQAREARYALRGYLETDPRWGRRRHLAWSHGVVTPHQPWAPDFSLPDLPRWALHGRDDMADLADRVRDQAERQADRVAPSAEDIELVAEILAGRRPTAYDVTAQAADRAERAERLTLEQTEILRVTRLLRRVEVRGGAGSGKTVLALAQARELVRGRGDRPPQRQRVALLCYSLGLAAYLRRQVEAWPPAQRPFVGTFHDFGRQWGAPDGDRRDSGFWEERLPALMDRLAGALTDEQRYDAILVDEAQDFADSWWTPVLKVLCVNEVSVRERARERLYVGLSRATDLLVVVGDPTLVRAMGGDEVAARLGIPSRRSR